MRTETLHLDGRFEATYHVLIALLPELTVRFLQHFFRVVYITDLTSVDIFLIKSCKFFNENVNRIKAYLLYLNLFLVS